LKGLHFLFHLFFVLSPVKLNFDDVIDIFNRQEFVVGIGEPAALTVFFIAIITRHIMSGRHAE
jgi:hypothetical protein